MISKHFFFSIHRLGISYLLGFMLSLYSCGNRMHKQAPGSSDQQFPVSWKDTTSANYARGFRITYHNHYKLLEILNPFQDQTDTLRYILKPRGVQLETNLNDAQIIDIPVRTMVVTSTTHLALAEILQMTTVIEGIMGSEYVYSKTLRERINSGDIKTFPPGELNKEEMLALNPDVIMTSGGQSSRYSDYQLLIRSGINVLVNADWLETSPLGKAEWVKVMGALLDREGEANARFGEIAQRYGKLKAGIDSVEERPLVINSIPYKGTWFMSGGNSYMATYLKDAGADYPWDNDSSTGSISLDFESVYEVGLRADVWLDPGAANTKEALLAKDARFKDFKSFKTGQIYNNNRRISKSGGNDFWESGVVHPDVVLADLIHIFHPNVLPAHSLYYFKRIK